MQSCSVPNPLHTNKSESVLCLTKPKPILPDRLRPSEIQIKIILKSLLKYNEKKSISMSFL